MSKGDGEKITIKFDRKLTNSIDSFSAPTQPLISGVTTSTASGSSSTIDVPTEAKAGDLLLLFFTKDDNDPISIVDGWVRLYSGTYGYKHTIVDKTIYNGVDTQITLTHDSEATSSIMVCIPAGDEVVISGQEANTSTPSPPTLTSGFVTGMETLWIAFAGCDYRNITGFPSNFTDNNIASNYYAGIGIATLNSINPSESPSNFTISGTDGVSAGTLAISVKSKEDLFNASLKAGLIITGEEYEHINGPLIDKNYEIGSSSLHPSYPIGDHLLIEVAPFNRFRNVEGNLTVTYDASLGSLMGRGGLLENFEASFLPLDLIPKLNPHQSENIVAGITDINLTVTEVIYTDSFLEENIVSSIADINIVVTKVGASPL